MLAFTLIARQGGEPLLRRLLDTSPGSLWSTDAQGNTLLHQALVCGRIDIATELIQRGLDPCVTNAAGERPLDVVAAAHPLLFGAASSGGRGSSFGEGAAASPGTSRSGSDPMQWGGGAGWAGGDVHHGTDPAGGAGGSSDPSSAAGLEPPPPTEPLPPSLFTLPDDVAVEVMKHLSLADALSLSEASRRFRRLGECPLLWEHFSWVHFRKTLDGQHSVIYMYIYYIYIHYSP